MAPDVDFLPSSYREAGAYHRYATLRIALVALSVGLLGSAAIYQQHLYRQAQREFSELTPIHDGAVAARKYLSELQTRLDTAEHQAKLATYLEHPWPRSRILVALAEPLPQTIELESLKISRERNPVVAQAAKPAHAAKSAEKQEQKPDPAELDLKTLRDDYDNSHVVVTITGVTHDLAELHRYLDKVGKLPLFTKVDLSSAQRIVPEASGLTRFTARVSVRPGYGQEISPPDSTDKLSKS